MINVGIIGLGRMGLTHYSIINSHPDVKIIAVADPSKLILNLIKKYIPDIRPYDDYNELLDKEDLNAILICTPPGLHYPVAVKAAAKGIHVFCEKPFTAQQDQALKLAGLFEKTRLVNQVGYVNRFNDVFQATGNYCKHKVIGNIIMFKSEMYSRTITKPDEGNTWRNSRENGGGALFEVASHAIDLVNYLVGKPDKVTGSCLTQIHSKNVEDAVKANFLYKNGISGSLNVNWSDESYRKPTNKIEIFGTAGKILADQHGFKIYMKDHVPEYNFKEGWNTRYITDVFKPVSFYVRGNEFTAQLYHFIDCIKDGSLKNLCTFRDALNTQLIISEIVNDYSKNGKFLDYAACR